ncbi:hypothetical protein [Antrihabitans cavernicola]|uniref:Secreted protein n=1 Tax=Antrihabitans cavernicola TaxID=2495913 RepID=A0A5A7SJ17_9NOCA|nr:hypothetical protein [Spelaeibacter cavernicola]KAA0024435.1 hypothetical protein FOY51_00230 [Spelaeibacter cavernicola]
MRLITRSAFVAAVSIPLALTATPQASASQASDVTYAFSVSGSTVKNTITNNSGSVISCTTSLAPAPGGVLPPIEVVFGGGQTLYDHSDIQPGSTTQSVTAVPDGSYVALASCARDQSDPAMWVSDYPGLDTVLKLFPNPSFAVQQASPVVTVPGASAPAIPGLPDFGSLSGR